MSGLVGFMTREDSSIVFYRLFLENRRKIGKIMKCDGRIVTDVKSPVFV